MTYAPQCRLAPEYFYLSSDAEFDPRAQFTGKDNVYGSQTPIADARVIDSGATIGQDVYGTQYRCSQDTVLLVFPFRPAQTEDHFSTYHKFLADLREHAT